MTTDLVPRDKAIAAAAAVLVEADQLAASMPPEQAARRAWTPTGPPVEELEARIRARRRLKRAS